jgi:hypothetical protein
MAAAVGACRQQWQQQLLLLQKWGWWWWWQRQYEPWPVEGEKGLLVWSAACPATPGVE